MTEALRLGDYSLEHELGRGAVGVVYRGRAADGRVVAIKTFDPALAGDDTFRARLAHEARVAREIVDPHLVRILPFLDPSLALADPKVREFTNNKQPKKVIVVPGKLVNVVV